MICSKCGTDNDINNIYCTKCGNELKKDNTHPNSEANNMILTDNSQNNNNENYGKNTAIILGIISLILFFLSPILFNKLASNITEQSKNIVLSIRIIFQLVGIIIMIYGRIKYPNNKFLKIVMWIIIVPIAFVILSIILLIGTCYGIVGYEG